MDTVDRSALLPYTTEEMYRLVSDIESYPGFLPWCNDALILSQDDDELYASIEFSVGGMIRSFTTRNRLQVNKMIEMRLVDGPFSRLQGCWQFEPLGDAGSKISLFLEYDFSNRMLGMVVGPAFNQIANTLVDAFQKRAVEVYGER
ncbi:MAG: type II toxin-antitoxin system RatA family toxin [Gammaproteobacteria bacterium]|nr:MAG: type II toxin-antitoxin system RatA family toxin [Gammaproteobacteria bacterium]